MDKLSSRDGRHIIWCWLALSLVPGHVSVVHAQVLEEIVVTAQRREQSLQEVPVSLEVFTADRLAREGFDNLKDLSAFAPGMVVRDMGEEQGLIVRGGGTQSKNFAVEQGVPTFIDGIYYGRGSMVKGQFMDLQQIELLKGPQPVFFGQNAGAGALNMTTADPTDEWEGKIRGEMANFGSREIEGAASGPITDTLGIRVAGRYDILEGYLTDYFSGRKFPMRETKAGRVTLQWTPNEQFQTTAKFGISENDLGPQAYLLVRDRFTLDQRQGESVLVNGIANVSSVPNFNGEAGDFSGNYGILQTSPYLSPNLFPGRLTCGNGGSNCNGVLDMSQWQSNCSVSGLQLFENFENCNFNDDSYAEGWNGVVDMVYELQNGIQVNSKTGYVRHIFWNSPNNTGGVFLTNPRGRAENSHQWSTELRVTSPTDGVFSWMAGASYQIEDLDLINHQANADGQRQIRGSLTSADNKWATAFATVSYNFFDNKASLDLGLRFTKIDKFGKGDNYAAMFIVAHPITGVPTVMPLGRSLIGNATDRAAGYDAIALAGSPFGFNGARIIGRTPYVTSCAELATYANSLVCASAGGGNTLAVGTQDVEGDYKENNYDPQVVLRYRPTEDISLYAKWVKSTKAGGFDAGVTEITRFITDWTFGPEKYENYEVGAKGEFLDGRLRTDLVAYYMDITGQQVSNIDEFLRRNVTQNIGASRTKGVELLTTFAATDNLVLTLSGALMDNIITHYPASTCTGDEVESGICNPVNSTIDRSGAEGVGAPSWSYTASMNYELPTILEGYRSNFNATYRSSDGYIDNRNFTKTVSYDDADDMNLAYEIGDEEENWVLSFFARNLLEVRPSLFPEFDLVGDGLVSSGDGAEVGPDAFTTYGVSFQMNFFN